MILFLRELHSGIEMGHSKYSSLTRGLCSLCLFLSKHLRKTKPQSVVVHLSTASAHLIRLPPVCNAVSTLFRYCSLPPQRCMFPSSFASALTTSARPPLCALSRPPPQRRPSLLILRVNADARPGQYQQRCSEIQ
jgi:UDP:flavonoid glycosyltransferase YjiC (YdhE family)